MPEQFRSWFVKKLKTVFKEFLIEGGWSLIPMVLQGVIFGMLNVPKIYVPTLLLWVIPAAIIMIHSYWVDCIREE